MMIHGGEYRWMLETVTFIQYEERLAVLSTAIDISEQIRSDEERQILESHLHQAQKMEAIGTLAGGIAHDFNSILGGIMGYSELVVRNLAESSRERRYAGEVFKACERVRELVSQILTFSRNGVQTHRLANITPVVKEAVKLLRASLPATIEIKSELDAVADMVSADPTQIHQVRMSLFTNAAHTMNGKGGTLPIGLKCRWKKSDINN